jgi:nitroimidazol reductase NimA-like FMN-containing flavoprotein (pyridoxamine 5'-phosphate oxidase superfamily)
MGDTIAQAAELVAAETTLVLATAGAGGPAAAPLFYWPEGLALYWLSSPESRHSRNLAGEPRAAVAVYASVRDWRDIRGVQMEGTASPVADSGERERVLAAYRKRFSLDAALDTVIARSVLFVFRPAWVRVVDNSKGFGYRMEATLEAY